MLEPNYETQLLEQGYTRVVGIDEAGRGCWAGPVAIGFYSYHPGDTVYEGVRDSKKISEKRRGDLKSLLETNVDSGVKLGEVREIEDKGIGKVIEQKIMEIITTLNSKLTFFLIDGQFSQDFGNNVQLLSRGDDTYYTIAAASILAKVTRDNLLLNLDQQVPGYGFASHKGYGTKQHREALAKLGVSQLHRKNYRPVAKLL